jgi:hypothetical protein
MHITFGSWKIIFSIPGPNYMPRLIPFENFHHAHRYIFDLQDCGADVASSFFPIEEENGKIQPLCERDYFRRLNLVCATCCEALKGSYITALGKKYHV